MSEDKETLLKNYLDMRRDLLAAIDGLSDALMLEPSIDGWSVKDHLAHIALWDDLRAAEVERISAGNETAWRMTGEQDATYNQMAYEMRRNLSLDQVRWEFETSRHRLIDALSAATPRGLDPALYGEAGLVSRHEEEHSGWIRRWRGEKGI
jgi:uncharacterized damage-inducible protein DinB